jgi:protein involved in polysaccharide export with SLBB domain
MFNDKVILAWLLLPILTAPIGVSLLGYVAISQIRHSRGRLYGLGLALFDALLFPLLALDGMISIPFYIVYYSIQVAARRADAASHLKEIGIALQHYGCEAATSPPTTTPSTAGALLLAIVLIILAILVDYWIIRWAWRTVNRPIGGEGTDKTSSTPHPTIDDAARAEARRQVRGPAIGLLVTGILEWVLCCLVVPFIAYMSLAKQSPHFHFGEPSATLLIALLTVWFTGSLVIFAALKMKRLQAYWLAVIASVLAIIISPSNLIGLPIGIWALVALSQQDVRAAFGCVRAAGSARAKGATSLLLAVLALVIVLGAIPLIYLWCSPSRPEGGSLGGHQTTTSTGTFEPFEFTSDAELKHFNSDMSTWFSEHGYVPDKSTTFHAIVNSDSWNKPGLLLCRRYDSKSRVYVFIPQCYDPTAHMQMIGYHTKFSGSIEDVKRYREDFASLELEYQRYLFLRATGSVRSDRLPRARDTGSASALSPRPQKPDQVAADLTHIQPLDVLHIKVVGTLAGQSIWDFYCVEPDGNVALGPAYGRANVKGLAVEQAEQRIAEQLKKTLTKPEVQVALETRGPRQWRAIVFPRPPHPIIDTFDVLEVRVVGTLPNQPIWDFFLVEAEGTIALGPSYGRVAVRGLTLEKARKAIQEKLTTVLQHPEVQVTFAGPSEIQLATAPMPKAPYTIQPGHLLMIHVLGTLPNQPIHDVFVVGPDGIVALGPVYGRVKLQGLTLEAAERAIAKKLKAYLVNPEVSVTPAGWRDDLPDFSRPHTTTPARM